MSRSWRDRTGYHSYRHRRASILAANRHDNGGRCTLNIPDTCTGTATQVHHVKGKRYGDETKHMVPACAECNRAVGDPARTANPDPTPHSTWRKV